MSYSVQSFQSLPQAFFAAAECSPEAAAYLQAVAAQGDLNAVRPRQQIRRTYQQTAQRVRAIAEHLSRSGLGRGARVAIISNTRPEWLEADLAILSAECCSVAIYHSLPPPSVAYILFDSGAEVVFAENQEQFDKLLLAAAQPYEMPGHEDRPSCMVQVHLKQIIAFEQVEDHPLVVQFTELVKESGAISPSLAPNLARGDLATIVYTSGTTGPPKGVMQTHGNHLANLEQIFRSGLAEHRSRIFLFLPLAHSFARVLGYLGLIGPLGLNFPAVADHRCSVHDALSLSRDIRESNAEIFPVVPRFLEKAKDSIDHAAHHKGIKGRVLACTLWAAQQHWQTRKAKRQAWGVRVVFLLSSWIRRKIRHAIFPRTFTVCVSGGAKLPEEVAEYFEALEIQVLEGYGLTEACVATNICRPEQKPIGSVGPPLDSSIEVKIAEDGEICVRGPNVSPGYYQRPTATRLAWDSEGWFHSGDLGRIDEQGSLYVLGRKKDLIITSGGKNIAPQGIEEQLQRLSLVSHAVVLGDGRKYCVALISLNMQEAARWLEQHQLSADGPLDQRKELADYIWQHVEQCNCRLAPCETIKKILIVPEEFTVENGQLTPTLKPRRNVIAEVYKKEIDRLYGVKGPG